MTPKRYLRGMSSAAIAPGESDSTQTVRQFGFLSVVVIAILAAVQGADPGIMNISLKSASEAHNIQGPGVSLAVGMGTLTLAATVIAVGALADRIGVRKVIMGGLVLEIVGNLIVSMSGGLEVLLIGRAIAGVGMGALFAGAFSMVPEIAGKKKVATIIGQWTGMLYVFLILITIVGSAMIGINWRYGFYIVPGVCFIMLFVVPFTLPETAPRGAGKFDVKGLGCLALGMVGLIYGVSYAATSVTSFHFWGSLLIGLAFLGLFALVEKKSDHACFPIDLFKSPVFVAAVLAGILWNFGEASLLLQAANFWQVVSGLAVGAVGIWQMPLLIVAAIGAFAAGGLLAKGRSPVVMMAVGFALLFLGLMSVAFTNSTTKAFAFLPALIMVGFGFVLVAVVQAREYLGEAPPKYRSAVVSSRTSVGQLGYSLGVALTSTIVTIGITKDGKISRDPAVFSAAFNNAMLISALIVIIGGGIAVALLAKGLKHHKNAAITEDPELAAP